MPVELETRDTTNAAGAGPATERLLDGDSTVRRAALVAVAALVSGVAGGARALVRGVDGLNLAIDRRSRAWAHERATRWEAEELRPGVSARQLLGATATATAIVLVAAVVVLDRGSAAVSGVAAGTLASGRISLPALPERSELLGADGSSLGVVQADEGNRIVVPLASVPKVLVDAVIDTEDADFWHHRGVDLTGVARAARRNATAGSVEQGGSTITQQLAKSTMTAPRRDLHRKLTEAVLAVRLDEQLGKRGVLERYLNTIYFGQGAYGVEAAAETYFAKPIGQLRLEEAALLAGLIRGPNLYDPVANAEAARARRATVLDGMVRHGDARRADADAAAQAPLPTAPARPMPAVGYVADAVRAELVGDERLGPTPAARAAVLAGGGLRVRTTVDPALQRQAQDAVTGGLPRAGGVTAALASVDPASGAVRALVGGPDYAASQFDAAVDGAGRQTGSAFKVFTLVAALAHGHVSTEQVDGNAPCPIPNPGGKPNPWSPENYEGEAFGTLTLADATAHSSNCAFARLASAVGADTVARTAHDMGITAPLQKVPSMTLGTNTIPPLQMAAAYATLAADGVAHTPHLVERVERRDGSVVLANDGGGRRAVDEQTARVATSVLTGVVTRGTGRAAALADRPVAGKTGTAQDHQDAWFVGYTPQLATAVWMGDREGERPMPRIGGIDVTGGSYPARIWHDFMAAALAGQPVVGFTAPGPEAAASAPATAPPVTDPSPRSTPPAKDTTKGGGGGKAKHGKRG